VRWIIYISVLALTLGLAACRDESQAPTPPPSGPSQFMSIMDIPCAQVQKQVRAKLKKDPALGLASEKKVDRGLGFVMPAKTQGDRRWTGVVMVQCFGPQSTRLSVAVSAQRKAQGKWQPDTDTSDIEKAVLDKLAP
jgi:hypothetical protein